MTTLEQYQAGFRDEPGYLDFARVSPVGDTVIAEQNAWTELLARARFGTYDELTRQDERVRAAAATLLRTSPEQVVFQPNTSTGLMHALFGVTGGVLLSPAEFPSLPFAAARASENLGVVEPVWLAPGPVTPAAVRERLTDRTAAVAVSLVDSRTGYLADLEGIRQVIGDRLLIVDAIQGFGVVDAPWEVADVVATGGQKWVRAGWGTGLLALGDRALERITPVISGFTGTDVDEPWDEVPAPSAGARAFSVSNPDRVAEARFAAALEEIAEVGVPVLNAAIAERVSAVIDIADEFGMAVSSPRDESERAGIVVLAPDPEQETLLRAALHNHGLSTRTGPGTVRVSVHATTTEETLAMLRAALVSTGTSVRY